MVSIQYSHCCGRSSIPGNILLFLFPPLLQNKCLCVYIFLIFNIILILLVIGLTQPGFETVRFRSTDLTKHQLPPNVVNDPSLNAFESRIDKDWLQYRYSQCSPHENYTCTRSFINGKSVNRPSSLNQIKQKRVRSHILLCPWRNYSTEWNCSIRSIHPFHNSAAQTIELRLEFWSRQTNRSEVTVLVARSIATAYVLITSLFFVNLLHLVQILIHFFFFSDATNKKN